MCQMRFELLHLCCCKFYWHFGFINSKVPAHYFKDFFKALFFLRSFMLLIICKRHKSLIIPNPKAPKTSPQTVQPNKNGSQIAASSVPNHSQLKLKVNFRSGVFNMTAPTL